MPPVYQARAYSKGGELHHMFSDHAAAVPAAHAAAFFVGVGERLARCAAGREQLPAQFSEPEAFIHHALLQQRVPTQPARWLAPLVVSVDGRAAKWCERYRKQQVEEVMRLGSVAGCTAALLSPTWTSERDGAGSPRCGAVARPPAPRAPPRPRVAPRAGHAG